MATPKFLWKEPERQIVLALLFSISVIMIRDLILTCVGKITSVKINCGGYCHIVITSVKK